MNEEIWKPVVGYEGFYEVSNFGRVRSLDRIVKRGKSSYLSKGRILKPGLSSTGYHLVNLYFEKKSKTTKVHRIVGFAFLPSIEGKEFINHKDGNPLNNNVENLEWCNQSENVQHAYNIGLKYSSFSKNKEIILAEYIENKLTIREISKKYKCSMRCISDYIKEKGVEIRKDRKYSIDKEELKSLFDKGLKNKEIAKKFNCSSEIIATYKYRYKKGELIK